MTFLPVVERELRVAARRPYTYWTRFFAALGTVALCTWIWAWMAGEKIPANERGLTLFRVISGLTFTYCVLAGIGTTADCLSEEKREGTLGLLFLTDLKGYDVVLGKLSATSLNSLYRLLSVFPILAIPLLLGALTGAEFWRMTLVLTNTLFFSLSAGMAVSAMSRHERRAMAGTALLLVLITAGPALLGFVLAARRGTLPANPDWLLSSAAYPAFLAADTPYRLHTRHFWLAVALTHLLGWGFLGTASLRIKRAWQDRPAVGRRALWQQRWRDWQFAHGPAHLAHRRGLLQINPIYWQTGRDRLRPVSAFGLVGGLLLVWMWLYWKIDRSWMDPTSCFLTAYCTHTLFKLWLSSEACRGLAEDRRTGALELILSTPLSVDEILDGQILALKRQFAWPVVIVLCLDFIMMIAGMRDRLWDSSNDWLVLCLSIMILFVADLYTLAWVGLWLGLNSKRATRAFSGTVARVLVLPWACFVLGFSLLAALPIVGFEPGEVGLLLTALSLCLLNDAIFFGWARTNLRERFRLVATQRFQPSGDHQAAASGAESPQPAAPAVMAR